MRRDVGIQKTSMLGSRGVRAQISIAHLHWQLQHLGISDQGPYRSPGRHSLHFKGILTDYNISISSLLAHLLKDCWPSPTAGPPGCATAPWQLPPLALPLAQPGALSSQGQGECHPVLRMTCTSAPFAASSSFRLGRQEPGAVHWPQGISLGQSLQS